VTLVRACRAADVCVYVTCWRHLQVVGSPNLNYCGNLINARDVQWLTEVKWIIVTPHSSGVLLLLNTIVEHPCSLIRALAIAQRREQPFPFPQYRGIVVVRTSVASANCDRWVFQNQFVHSCCIHIRPWWAGPTGSIVIMYVRPFWNVLHHFVICFRYVITMHFYQLAANFDSGIVFTHKNRNHITSFFAASGFQCRCTSTYPLCVRGVLLVIPFISVL
jgi:hypothetical protein